VIFEAKTKQPAALGSGLVILTYDCFMTRSARRMALRMPIIIIGLHMAILEVDRMSWEEYIGNMRFWQQPRGSGDRSDLVIETLRASGFNRTRPSAPDDRPRP